MKLTALLALTFCSLAHAANHATVTGIVTDVNGKSLVNATVLVYQAGVRTGYNIYCPSCYTDCGKRARTDAAGHYSIGGLRSDLLFNMLIIKNGYSPLILKRVDPLQGPAPEASLPSRKVIEDTKRIVRGHVVDEQGTPVSDALVETKAILLAPGDRLNDRFTAAGTTVYGTLEGLDSVAVTNHDGDFEIAYTQPGEKLAVMIEPRAQASKYAILRFGAERQTVKVMDGAVVRGRLIENGRPVAEAEIGLRPQHPWSGGGNLQVAGSWYDEIRIGTRHDGTFAITSVPIPDEWNLFGKMESLKSQGATEPVTVSATNDHQDINLGDILVKQGYWLRGRVALSDGKPIGTGMRVSVALDSTQDDQTAMLPPDGHFEFGALAPGKYTVWASVKGYKPQQNLKAVVDHDVDGLLVSLDPVRPVNAH